MELGEQPTIGIGEDEGIDPFQEAAPKPVMSIEEANFLAFQSGIAAGDLSPKTFTRYQQMHLFGKTKQAREEIATKRSLQNNQLRPEALSTSLAVGDVEGATALVQQTDFSEPPEASMEIGAAEQATATEMFDPQKNINMTGELDDNTRAKLLMYVNAYNEVSRKVSEKYDYLVEAGTDTGESLYEEPKASKVNLGHVRMAADMLMMMMFQTDYAFAKNLGSTVLTFAPGHASQRAQEVLADPNTSPQHFAQFLANYQNDLETIFLGDFFDNPMKYISAMEEAILTKSGEDSEFVKLLRSMKTFINEKGEVQPNPFAEDTTGFLGFGGPNGIKDIYDPNSTLDRMMYNPWFSTVLDNPVFDITQIALPFRIFKTIRKIWGAQRAAQIVSSSLLAGQPIQHVTFGMATQFANPRMIQDADVLAYVQDAVKIAESGLADVVEAQRVQTNPTALADEIIKVRTDVYNQPSFAWAVPAVEGPNNFLDVFHRSQAGTPFRTKQAAEADAQRRGFLEYSVEEVNGGFYIKTRYSLNDERFIDKSAVGIDPKGLKERLALKNIRNWSDTILGKYTWWGRKAYSPNTNVPEMIEGGTSGSLEVGKYAHLFDSINKPLADLGWKEQRDLAKVIKSAQQTPNPTARMPKNRGKWLNEVELDDAYRKVIGRAPTKNEKKGYFAFRINSDLAYTLMNKRMYDEFVSKGYQHWTFRSGPIDFPLIAKVVHDRSGIDEHARVMVHNGPIVEGKYVKAADLQNPDNIILKVSGVMDTGGDQITHIIWKKSDVETSGLMRHVLGYTEGGTRAYHNSNFIKTKIKGKIPHTLGVASTPGAAKKLAQQYNDLLAEYKNFIRDRKAMQRNGTLNTVSERVLRMQYDNTLQRIHSGFDLNRLELDIKEGRLDPENKVHALKDREPFPDEKPIRGEPPITTYQYKGRMFYSPRGEHLLDETDQLAELMNPFESLARQQGHAIRVAGFGQFAIKEMQAWGSRYKEYLDTPMKIPTTEELFLHGEWKQGAMTAAMRNQAEAQREYIQRILRQPTDMSVKVDRVMEEGGRVLADLLGDQKWISDKYFHSLKTGKILSESDALNFLKGQAYTIHLGMFSIKQLWMQASAASIGIRLHPLYGMAAVKDLPLIRAAATMDFNNHLVKVLDEKAAQLGNHRAGEFKQLLDDYRKTGLNNVGYTDTMMDRFPATATYGAIQSKLNKMNDAQRFFVYEGDRIGRIVVFGIARRKALDKVREGVFKQGSHEYINYIRGEVQRLHVGMLSGAESWYQRNEAVSLMFQMKQYSFKMAEIFLGLNRSFTAKEKIALVTTEAFGYGVLGIPLGSSVYDWFHEEDKPMKKEEKMPLEDFKKAYFGFYDYFIRDVLGHDTAVSSQLGTGDAFSFVRDLFSKNFALVATGLVGKDIEKFNTMSGNMAFMVGTYLSSLDEGDLEAWEVTDDVLGELGKFFSGTNAAMKAYYAYKYDTLLSSNQQKIQERNTDWPWWLTALGVQNADEFIDWKEAHAAMKDKENLNLVAKKQAEWEREIAANYKQKNMPGTAKYRDYKRAIRQGLSPEERAYVDREAVKAQREQKAREQSRARGIYWSNE